MKKIRRLEHTLNAVFFYLLHKKEKSLIVEVNTRGIYKKRSTDFYPSTWILPIMREMNVPVVISSDAHLPSELTLCFKEAEEALKAVGYKETMCFRNGGYEAISL